MTKIIYNGKVYLGRGKFCDAIMIDKGRIKLTGTGQDLLLAAPQHAEKIDASGALVLPAFHDSHLHLMWLGRREGAVECAGARSIDEVITRCREYIAKIKPAQGAYVQGYGVNPDLFSEGEKRDLCREDLDRVSAGHPVILSRHCGHIIYCNSLALKLAGYSDSAPEVEGGEFEKDEKGRPTGVSKENANALVRKPMPAETREETKGFVRLAMQKVHSLGITSCGSFDVNGPDFENIVEVYRDIYDECRKAGRPGLRLTMQCGISGREDLLDTLVNRGRALLWEDPLWGTFLKIGSLKLFADGTLGGHSAWMRQPYKDKPDTRGIPVLNQETLNNFVQKAAAGGMQVLVHAIGDACMDAVLTAFEKVTGPDKNPLRHGIIHCQITTPDLLERMARNKILAVVQPIFLADDMSILESRVGPELASTSYAWGTMQRLGVPVSYSSDAPVSPPNPLHCIEWAVLRRDSEDPGSTAFCPSECVDVSNAVDSYTETSVYPNFDELILGRIETGRYADLVFLDRDIFSIPPEEIHRTKVVGTLCAGETVYSA